MIQKSIQREIENYLTGKVEISEGYTFSQYALIKRIMLYSNGIYPTGKIDKQGKYKYFFDICSPRIDSEIKNIDFDTKDVKIDSDGKNDFLPVFIANLSLKEWMRNNKESVDINDAVELGSGWGNVVWKKVKGGYEIVDLKNFYVLNQTAQLLEDSPVIERHILTQSELRAKSDIWKNVDDVIETCGDKTVSAVKDGVEQAKAVKYYEIYERNGEISEQDLREAQGKKGGKEEIGRAHV